MNIVQVIIEILRRGDGAKQAREELDQLKDSADTNTVSAAQLHTRLRGLSNVFVGLSVALSSASSGIRGIAMAIGGFFQLVVAHPIGRMITALAVLASTIYGVYRNFSLSSRAVKENADETLKAADAAQTLDKSQKALAQPVLRTAAEYAKQLADEFDRAADAASRARKNVDELSSAELALTLATIDRDVAAGKITEEQGKQQRIEARLAQEKARNDRESADIKDQVAVAEKRIAEASEEYDRAKQQRDKASAEYLKLAVSAAEKFPSLRGGPTDYTAAIAKASTQEERNAITAVGRAKKEVEFAETGVGAAASDYYSAQEKYSPVIESGKSRLQTLAILSKASEVSASAQSIEISKTITRKQVEEEKQKLAAISAEKEKQELAAKQHEADVFRSEKTGAVGIAEQALGQQRAEEQAAKIQLSAAERAAGARGQSSRERKASAAALQSARGVYAKEAADVSQAEALAGKIRETVDPAALANLIRSIEHLGSNVSAALNNAAAAVNDVNSKVSQQSSQIKNGGLRTK